MVCRYPNKANETKEATDALLLYLTDFQAALNAPDWLTRQGNGSYSSYIDGPSFVDFFLVSELSKNPDSYRGSTYMSKDRDGPLSMGPVWDYNEGECRPCSYRQSSAHTRLPPGAAAAI